MARLCFADEGELHAVGIAERILIGAINGVVVGVFPVGFGRNQAGKARATAFERGLNGVFKQGVAVFLQVCGGGGQAAQVGVERLWVFVHAGQQAVNHLERRFAVFDIEFAGHALRGFIRSQLHGQVFARHDVIDLGFAQTVHARFGQAVKAPLRLFPLAIRQAREAAGGKAAENNRAVVVGHRLEVDFHAVG